MRADSGTFAAFNEAPNKSLRFVIGHIFDVESVYCTSHEGIPNVPGVVIENVIEDPSAISQHIVPDEGRSEIGSFTYRIVDLDSAFTNEAREKLLTDDKSFRGKLVRYYVGYEGMDFTEFQLFQTQVVKDIGYDAGVYTVSCADITRQQREEIFDPKKTTLRDTVDADDTTIPVYSTTGFEPVFHGPSYSDGPNSTVGYFKLEDEIIRYTGTTSDTFTGCTRGVLNTKAVAHTVDAGADAERRPKIEEVVYLELPAVKLAYAILTGVLHDDTATLPDHWHCGIDASLVKLSDFTGIGTDLWNTSLDTEGFVVRFQGLSKIDAKRFLEAELFQLLGCYSPVYSDGRVGLKRMNQVLANAAYAVELNETNVVSVGELNHNFSGMHNRLQIDWNWNGREFTRSTLFLDAQSIAIHGKAPLKKLQFKGLHGSRHTEAIIRKRLDAFRDRYSAPPETVSVTVMPSLNRLEVGDIVRMRLTNVRDFAGSTASIDRSFEIQRKSQSDSTGDVTLELFGSTAPASVNAPNDTGGGNAVPDAFYTATGTDLTTVTTIVPVGDVGVIQVGTYDLPAGIYYYDGDLELANGATLTINGTVQIRVAGFFTVNGDIDGVGRGKPGQADSGDISTQVPGLPGFLGNSRGMDGLIQYGTLGLQTQTTPCAFTQGQYSTFPFVDLTVSGIDVLGIPSDLAGTSGGAGGKLGFTFNSNPLSAAVEANGGTGGDSGAGIVIISRGLAFGASGLVDLSGDDAASTSPVEMRNGPAYPGAGGAGTPGALLILLDGSAISIPDLGGKFVAACGTVPVNGIPLTARQISGQVPPVPQAGYQDEAMISGVDLSNVAYRIQYIPGEETPEEDQDTKPPPITGMSVSGVELGNVITLTLPDVSLFDTVELYAAITNDRTGAVRVADDKANVIRHQLPAGVQRYYWARTKKGDVVSDWFPSSSTGGVTGSSVASFIAQGNCEIAGQVARKVGGSSAWDSHVYSLERYLDGAQVTFKADQTDAELMVGLNSDPTTDQNYTSIDYQWYPAADGNAYIYEGSSNLLNTGAYTTSTIFTVRHDGRRIQYIKDGAIVREAVVGSAALHMDSSFYSPGAQISRLQFGPSNPVRPHPWVTRGNCIAGVSTASKVGGSNGWDSDVYSVESYNVCHLVFKSNQTNAAVMVGLNTDPLTDSNYTSIDYAWYCEDNGTLDIREAGTEVVANVAGGYSTSTELAITYDGSNVRYYRDRVLIRTSAVASQRFYADSSFFSTGAAINSLRFGPGTSLELTDTPQIGDYATTDAIAQAENSGTVSVSSTIATTTTTLLSVAFTPTASGEAKISGGCDALCTNSGGSPSSVRLELLLDATTIDSKRIALGGGSIVPNDLRANMLTKKTTVTGGTTYTAYLVAISASGDASSPYPGFNFANRVIRVEVNKK